MCAPRVLRRVREPHVASTGISGAPSAPVAAKSGASNSRAARQRRALALGAADDRLLLERARRGPRSRSSSGSGGRRGSCRRPSTPGRRGADAHTCSASRSGSSAVTLAVPSLKPMRLRGRGLRRRGRRRTPEAELRPAHAHDAEPDAREVAHRVHRDLRVVGAGLDAQVAAAALAGRASSPANAGSSSSAGGRRSARPKRSRPSASANSDRPDAEGEREPRRREADRLAGVVRRRLGDARRPRRPGRRRRRASCARPRRSRPAAARRARRATR